MDFPAASLSGCGRDGLSISLPAAEVMEVAMAEAVGGEVAVVGGAAGMAEALEAAICGAHNACNCTEC